MTTSMMSSNNAPVLTNTILLFVYDDVVVLDCYEATSCSFVVVDGVSFGYQYADSESGNDKLDRAFDIIFDKTFERLKSKGINLLL